MTSRIAPAPADYRAVSEQWHRDDVTGNADKVDKAAVAFHEGMCEGTYSREDMRKFWSSYREQYVSTDSHLRGQAAAMMCAVEDAVKSFEVTQQRRQRIDRPMAGVVCAGCGKPGNRYNPLLHGSAGYMHSRCDHGGNGAQQQQTTRAKFANIPGGHYATEASDGTVSFWKVDEGKGKWDGFRFVVEVTGDHHRRLDRAAQTAALTAIGADITGAMQRYGKLIGKCGKCHRRLTDETSRNLGIGPECRKGMGLDDVRVVRKAS